MKFGRCRERRSKLPTPRKGHQSAKLPSQEPLQTSASRSTSSTPGETPSPNSAASHHGRTRPAGAVGAALAPGIAGQEGLPEASWDGWWLAETSERGPDVTGGAATGCAGRLPTRHPHSRILLACGQNCYRLSLRTRQGMGTELRWWWGGITWDLLAGIPASLTSTSEPLPHASRPPKGFLSSSENNQSNKRKTWEWPDCFLFMQDSAGAECSQRCLRPRGNAAHAVGGQQGTMRGAYGGEVAGRGLETSSVPAVSCVLGAHTDLLACTCGLMDGELKGRQGLLVASCPPDTAVQAKPVHLSVRSAVGRVGAAPTRRQPGTCGAAGGSRRGPEDGGGCWQRLTFVGVWARSAGEVCM